MVFSVCCCFVGCGYQTDEKHKVERVSIRDQYSLQCSSYKLGKSYTLCMYFTSWKFIYALFLVLCLSHWWISQTWNQFFQVILLISFWANILVYAFDFSIDSAYWICCWWRLTVSCIWICTKWCLEWSSSQSLCKRFEFID